MKTINPNIWPYVLRLTIAVGIVAAICMAFAGCSPARQLEKAKQRVLLNPSAFDEVGRKYVDLNPCTNDSTSEFKAGGIDSATIQEYYDWVNGKFYTVDTSWAYRLNNTDDVKGVTTPYIGPAIQFGVPKEDVKKAFAVGYKQGVKDFIAKHPPRLPDTLKTSVKDKQLIKLLEADIARVLQENAHLKGVIKVKDETIETLHKKVTGWIWWLVLVCSLGVAGIVAAVFIRAKKLPL